MKAQIKKALSALTPKALLKIIPSQNRNESMNNNRSNLENNQDIPSNPRKAVLEGYISCFYILRKQDNAYRKVCCFLDEYNVKRAYSLIRRAFPKEQFFICDELIDRQCFNFWSHARKHVKSLKKVNQLTGFSSKGIAA